MKEYSVLKRILINIGLILFNTLVFSDAFIGLRIINGSVVSMILGVTVILLSIIIFVRFNGFSFLRFKNKSSISGKKNAELLTLQQYSTMLTDYTANNDSGFFNEGLHELIKQITQYEIKCSSVRKMLPKLFEVTEMTYQRFVLSINSSEEAIIGKIKVFAQRLEILNNSIYSENNRALYNEFAIYLKDTAAYFTEINSKMDNLQIELTKLHVSSAEEIQQSGAACELQRLVETIKLYK
ncbi:MAG: hypothetical protein FWG61_03770 [Firmicutes bacterium]|nr:hypothetical protein [Bacillota bacterium]